MADYIGSKSAERIQGLDALRTLAIVCVTLFHMFPDVVKGGYLGVSLFFVLTGYLLAYTTEKERLAGNFSITRYFLKRFWRIYPPLLVMLFVTLGVYSFFLPELVQDVREEVISIVFGYNNWWQIAGHADYFARIAYASPFTHLWFMGIELQYAFFVWPLLFLFYISIFHWAGKGASVALVALFGLGASSFMPLSYFVGVDLTRLYYGTDTRIFELFLGAAMGLWRAGVRKRSALEKPYSLYQEAIEFVGFEILLVVVVFASIVLDGSQPFLYNGGMLFVTLIFCLLLALTASYNMSIGKFLDAGLFRWLGKRSYGIYLWQYPVIFFFEQKGLDTIAYASALEIAVIVILAMWTEALTKSIGRRKLPSIGNRLVYVQGAFFLAFTLGGIFLMGFGCKGLAAPSGHKEDARAELTARLLKNAENLKQQKEAAAKEAKNKAPQDKVPKLATANLSGISCIGDSVMLAAAEDLQTVLPSCTVDAEISRYVGGGIEAAQELKAKGRLGSVVVVALGTNGPIADGERYIEQTQALLALLGTKRQIFWVNIYAPHLSWQDTNNAYIQKLATERKNVCVIDWHSLVASHPEWLSEDGVHPNEEGTEHYAKLVRDTLADSLAKKM